MKVLLIAPPLHGLYHAANIVMPPMNLMYVGAVLEEAGHEVGIRDLTTDGSPLDYDGVDVVGITCSTPQYLGALEIAREAHESGKIVMMGGCHVSFTAADTLRTGLVDYVVHGEGELTAVELMEGLHASGNHFDPSKVSGISWWDKEQDRIVRNPERPSIEDVDALPYPGRHLLNMEPYKITTLRRTKPATTMITSRGCPFKCTYCTVPKTNAARWRSREPSAVLDEIELLQRQYGFEGVLFMDDNFTLNTRRIMEICDGILERSLDIVWWCQSRADTLANNEPMVAKMVESGCCTVFVGLESGNDSTLKAFNKRTSTDVGEKAVRLLNEYGIHTHGAFMIGELSETQEAMQNTIDYAKRIDPEFAQFSIMTPYPGTDLYEELKARILTHDWAKYDGTYAVFEPEHMPPAEVEGMLRKAYREFYMRPRRFLNRLRGLNLSQVKAILSHLRRDKG